MMLASNQTEDEEVCPKNEVSAIERKTSKLDARSSCDIRVSTDKSRISARGLVWEDIKHIALQPEFVKSKVFVSTIAENYRLAQESMTDDEQENIKSMIDIERNKMNVGGPLKQPY